MNYVSPLSQIFPFLPNIYGDSLDVTYIKLRRYERVVLSNGEKERGSSVHASLSVKVGKARGIHQWNELASDLASDNCHINTALG